MSTDRAAVPAIARPSLGAAPVPKVPVPARWTLANGLRVIAVPWHTFPQVAARLIVPAGSVSDPPGLYGTASMVGEMLTEGTGTLSAEALNARLDLLGASLGAHVGHDFAEVDLFMLSETLREGLVLLSSVLTDPSFPAPELERLRAETLDALDARDDEPANVADDRTAELVFGTEHPYARQPAGTPESVSSLSRSDLIAFHRRHYRPAGSVLIVAGAIEPESLRQLLDEVLGGWQGAVSRPTYPAQTPLNAGAEPVRLPRDDSPQGEIRVAGPGLSRTSADWITAGVANYLLGGSTITGRLGANLREDKGWTYGIRSGFAPGVQAGGWMIETAVDAEVIDAAFQEIDAELTRFAADDLPEEELRRAKDALILSLPRAFETPGRIVGRFGMLEAFGLETDYWERFPARVEAVTREDVRRIAQQHFRPEALVRVVVGPP